MKVADCLVCSVCGHLLNDPVRADPCEHTFCRACIEQSLARSLQCPASEYCPPVFGIKPADRIVIQMIDSFDAWEKIYVSYSSSYSSSSSLSETSAANESVDLEETGSWIAAGRPIDPLPPQTAEPSRSAEPVEVQDENESLLNDVQDENDSLFNEITAPQIALPPTEIASFTDLLECNGCGMRLNGGEIYSCNDCLTLFCSICHLSAEYIHDPDHSFLLQINSEQMPANEIEDSNKVFKSCGHACDLSPALVKCCACIDSRPFSVDKGYMCYIDGLGFTRNGTRYQHYCVCCKARESISPTQPPPAFLWPSAPANVRKILKIIPRKANPIVVAVAPPTPPTTPIQKRMNKKGSKNTSAANSLNNCALPPPKIDPPKIDPAAFYRSFSYAQAKNNFTGDNVTSVIKACDHQCLLGQHIKYCCECEDKRPIMNWYEKYVDGEGIVKTASRHEFYCFMCKERKNDRRAKY
ncbi:hypothetical protein HK100_000167 [Physocladia obscura]|uniref:RING-type domain-containing protein n=1 Tax=Physocladia obscura TaxID=109957 RepID=A0AAD5T1K4_9FUNG|nr:hypothetical protein HK100_000167 [Physocladia obscura]